MDKGKILLMTMTLMIILQVSPKWFELTKSSYNH